MKKKAPTNTAEASGVMLFDSRKANATPERSGLQPVSIFIARALRRLAHHQVEAR